MSHALPPTWTPKPGVFAPEQDACLRELADSFGVDFLHEMFEDLCVEGAKRVEEMQRAVAAGDHRLLESAAHRLGSMVLSLGFADLGALCRRVESDAEESLAEDAAARVVGIADAFARLPAFRHAL